MMPGEHNLGAVSIATPFPKYFQTLGRSHSQAVMEMWEGGIVRSGVKQRSGTTGMRASKNQCFFISFRRVLEKEMLVCLYVNTTFSDLAGISPNSLWTERDCVSSLPAVHQTIKNRRRGR